MATVSLRAACLLASFCERDHLCIVAAARQPDSPSVRRYDVPPRRARSAICTQKPCWLTCCAVPSSPLILLSFHPHVRTSHLPRSRDVRLGLHPTAYSNDNSEYHYYHCTQNKCQDNGADPRDGVVPVYERALNGEVAHHAEEQRRDTDTDDDRP